MNIILSIIASIFIGVKKILGFIINHIVKGIGILIQQITIKAGMIIFGFALLGYIATHL